jgi:hypothetical protein
MIKMQKIERSNHMAKKEYEKNVIVAVFKVESEGYQALSELKLAAGGETYLISAAALVKKEKDSCVYLDGFDTGVHTSNDAVIGGLIGMTVGLLAGPIGMLLGGSYGTLIGMTVDAEDAAFGASMLDQIAQKLDDGMIALIALAGEESNDALDAKLSKFDTVIARFDADVVAEEVDKAYEAQAAMAKQANEELRREKLEEAHDDVMESFKQGSENFKSDMAFTAAAIKELRAERKAAKQAKKEEKREQFEENSETLRQNFTK